MTKDVNEYFEIGCGRCPKGGTPDCKVHLWTDELAILRSMLLQSELQEESKWGMPTYTYNGKNVLILSAFQSYASLNFFKGALIKDEHNVLVKVGPNAEVSRIIKIISVAQIKEQEFIIRTLIEEAIEIEKLGLKPKTKKVSELNFPQELLDKFKTDPDYKSAFEALTPGRQKSYLFHFNGAKQSATITTRIEKCTDKIMAGKGFNEY